MNPHTKYVGSYSEIHLSRMNNKTLNHIYVKFNETKSILGTSQPTTKGDITASHG